MILAAQTENRDHELLKAMVPQNRFFLLHFNLPEIPTNFARLHRVARVAQPSSLRVATFCALGNRLWNFAQTHAVLQGFRAWQFEQCSMHMEQPI